MTVSPSPPARGPVHGAGRAGACALLLALASCGEAPADAAPDGTASAPVTPPAEPPHVVIWMVDTLRADHLGAYGYERDTSPSIDAVAAEGVVFEQMHAHANWTQPSVASIITGTHPPVFRGDFTSALPGDALTAAEWYSAHGYATAGFTVTVAVGEDFGFQQGYDVYEELDEHLTISERKKRLGEAFDADVLVDRGLAWLDGRGDDERPFLLYLHSVDPHSPYQAHEGYRGWWDPEEEARRRAARLASGEPTFGDDSIRDPAERRSILDRYDGEIVFNDAHFGRLVEGLERRGLAERTLVVVVSDHGEEFWERNTYGHGHRNVHAELTHIPFILRGPGLPAGVRVPGLARAVDILPTLVELCGLPPVPGVEGVSLVPAIERAAGVPPRPHFVGRYKKAVELRGVRTPEHLFVVDPVAETRRLYDVARDPGATVDVAREQAERVRELGILLRDWERQQAERSGAEAEALSEDMDARTYEKLKALGYLR